MKHKHHATFKDVDILVPRCRNICVGNIIIS